MAGATNTKGIASRNAVTQIETACIVLTGTATSSGTAVTGTGTAFDTELSVGDIFYDFDGSGGGSGEGRIVSAIASAVALTLATAFTVDLGATDTVSGVAMSTLLFVSEMSMAGKTVDVIDITNLTDTFKSFAAGNVDPGQDSFTYWFSPKNANHKIVYDAVEAGANRWIIFWIPDAESLSDDAPPELENSHLIGRGFLQAHSITIPTGGAVSSTVPFQNVEGSRLVAGIAGITP